MSLRKSSRRRNGSKSAVLPKPNARRRWTPAPSRVGLALTSRLTGRIDMMHSHSGISVAHYPTVKRCRTCAGSERVRWPPMLHGYPVVPGELVDDPVAAEPPEAAVLLAAERPGRRVVHAAAVYVRHPGLDAQRELQAALLVAREDGA